MIHLRVLCFALAFGSSVTMLSQNSNDSLPHKMTEKEIIVDYTYHILRRNFAMTLIPSMHSFAEGEREHKATEHCRLIFKDSELEDIQILSRNTSIRHNRNVMSILNAMLLPNLKCATLYGSHILSPFNEGNRRWYSYEESEFDSNHTKIRFKPRFCNNTLLVSGTAIVSNLTGNITFTEYDGEFDMIKFHVNYNLRRCKTNIDFHFLGNHVKSEVVIRNATKSAIETINRKIKTEVERDSLKRTPTEEADTTKKGPTLESIGINIGDHLLSSHSTKLFNVNLNISPLLEPHYLNYSHRRGLSYKMRFSAEYGINDESSLTFTPELGYNFKIKQFFFLAPLRYTYNKEKDNYVEISYNNGNRIYNSSVIEELKRYYGEYFIPKDNELDMFDNKQLKLTCHYNVNKWLTTDIGFNYHKRSAVDKHNMMKYAKENVYRSFAPNIGIKVVPWKNGPVLSMNYERSIKGSHFNLDYERMEGSASYILKLPATQKLNFRMGGGLYSRKHSNIFMDYAYFSENNLPGGWDDDWTGDFQLLDSRLYNISNYYISGNASYHTPILLTSFIPFINKYIERERFYLNTLCIQHCRPYSEIGYGISTRVLSVGVFASFFNCDIQDIGAKFTFELFHRW